MLCVGDVDIARFLVDTRGRLAHPGVRNIA